MKTRLSPRRGLMAALFALSTGLTFGTMAFAADGKAPAGTPPSAYPLTTCVVSGDALGGGDMGPPVDYIHKEAGKPDRLVRLCCKGCVKDFKKEPAKYLKMIDDAAAGKPQGDKPAAPGGHSGHTP